MKRLTSLTLTVLMLFCVLVSSERRAWAYVDPGTGLIALQTFASVLAASAYVARRKIRSWFGRGEAKPDSVRISQEPSRRHEAA
ncbi:MAG: hypothetical protein M3O02_11445 [Acidobacteriota bacterium]|nr:hypothetical protein [Acidobacteriota bacterium]